MIRQQNVVGIPVRELHRKVTKHLKLSIVHVKQYCLSDPDKNGRKTLFSKFLPTLITPSAVKC